MDDPAGPARTRPHPRRRRWARRALVVVVLGVVLVLAAAGFVQVRLTGQLGRIDGAFTGLTDRPARPAGGGADAVNLLVLTTDRLPRPVAADAVRAPGWTRSVHVDSVLVWHFDSDRRAASVVTVPMATPVSLPLGPGAAGRLEAVLPRAAPAGLVGGVERLTGVRIDHLAVLDWAGLARLVSTDHGVEVPDPVATDGRRTHLGARAALDYVRGDLGAGGGSIRREQYVLRAVLDATLHQELRKEPLALFSVLDVVTRHLAVESGWSGSAMRNLVISLRNMRSYSIGYVAMPSRSASLWRAVRDDEVAAWSRAHPGPVLPFATG